MCEVQTDRARQRFCKIMDRTLWHLEVIRLQAMLQQAILQQKVPSSREAARGANMAFHGTAEESGCL